MKRFSPMNIWLWIFWLWWNGWLALAGLRGADYYVSPAGDDAHDGRGPEPTRAFRTIQHGVDALTPGDRLLIRAGTYRETITFHRNGEPGAPIVVMAYPGEQPVISGLEPLTGWVAIGNDRWTTAMPWTLGRGKDQLFANGAPLIEARHPNASAPGRAITDEKGAELPQPWPRFGTFALPDPNRRFDLKFPAGESFPAGWWNGAIYVGQHWDGYQAQSGIVESGEGDALHIYVEPESQDWWFPRLPLGAGLADDGRGMLVGHIHALDAEGEWVRGGDGTVTLQHASTTAPVGIEAKRRHLAFDLSQRRHVELRGVRMLGASACLRDARGCVLQGCTFEWYAHFTWFAASRGNIEQVNFQTPMEHGETGLYVSGSGNLVRDCTLHGSAGGGVILDGWGNTVHNCLIEHTGYGGTELGPIYIEGDYFRYGGGHRITRNTLRHASRSVLTMDGGYFNSPARLSLPFAASLVEGNELATGMLIGRDGGLVYLNCTDGGAWNGLPMTFRHNVIHDSHHTRFGTLFYLDCLCWHFDVRENVLWSSPLFPAQTAHFYYFPTMEATWVGNRELGAVDKSAATLNAADFPAGRRFAFGHDFVHPPAIPAWLPLREWSISPARHLGHSAHVVLEGTKLTGWRDGDWATFDVPLLARWQTIVLAESCTAWEVNHSRGSIPEPRHTRTADPLVLAPTSAEEQAEGVMGIQTSGAWGLHNGSWLRFRNVSLGAGFRQVRFWYASAVATPKHAEIHLDRTDGPLLASIPLPESSGTIIPTGYTLVPVVETVAPVAATASGTHDLYVVWVGEGTAELAQWFQANLENYRGTLPPPADEVCVEVRARDKEGPVLAKLYPIYPTGDPIDRVAALDTSQLTAADRRLCLVVRSQIGDPQLALHSIRLQRGPMR